MNRAMEYPLMNDIAVYSVEVRVWMEFFCLCTREVIQHPRYALCLRRPRVRFRCHRRRRQSRMSILSTPHLMVFSVLCGTVLVGFCSDWMCTNGPSRCCGAGMVPASPSRHFGQYRLWLSPPLQRSSLNQDCDER